MILELRILPPLAIARLGSSPVPLANYQAVVDEANPVGYRRIVPAPTLAVDAKSGRITSRKTPKRVEFKDSRGRIHPLAPFFELWVRLKDSPGDLVPLTTDILKNEGLAPSDVAWSIEVANIKAFRRTRNPNDSITALVEPFTDHGRKALLGRCEHFRRGQTLPLGFVQYIRPTTAFPEIRLRFTPAAGKVYGPLKNADTAAGIYDSKRGTWDTYSDDRSPPNNPSATHTAPPDIFYGVPKPGDRWEGRGYLDDECDGIITASLTIAGKPLTAIARVGAGPPAFAPDSFPIRTVADELEQALLGPDVAPEDLSPEATEEIVRRAMETVRLMNTTVLNGNIVNGENQASDGNTMPSQDTPERAAEPIMATSLVDNLSLVALHQTVLNALRAGSSPWFLYALRRYDEVADLTTLGRRKMPAMMRGADSYYLALTRRQREKILKTARQREAGDKPGAAAPNQAEPPRSIVARNLTAQLHHRAAGNPPGSRPDSAISNCFPGLEFDFRNLWRRAFVGIVVSEYDNLIVGIEDEQYAKLLHHRILRVGGDPIAVAVRGPGPVDPRSRRTPRPDAEISTGALEWSNAIARVQHAFAGRKVTCELTRRPSLDAITLPPERVGDGTLLIELGVRPVFEPDTAVIDRERVVPGELTQSLCSPWQNDYRECACYYWASSRPDYVNVEPTADGQSRGHNWLQKNRRADTPKEYSLAFDDSSIMVSYHDLFQHWERSLRFAIEGQDAE